MNKDTVKKDLEEITQSTWTDTTISSGMWLDVWLPPYHGSPMEHKVLEYCSKNRLNVQINYSVNQIFVWVPVLGEEG